MNIFKSFLEALSPERMHSAAIMIQHHLEDNGVKVKIEPVETGFEIFVELTQPKYLTGGYFPGVITITADKISFAEVESAEDRTPANGIKNKDYHTAAEFIIWFDKILKYHLKV